MVKKFNVRSLLQQLLTVIQQCIAVQWTDNRFSCWWWVEQVITFYSNVFQWVHLTHTPKGMPLVVSNHFDPLATHAPINQCHLSLWFTCQLISSVTFIHLSINAIHHFDSPARQLPFKRCHLSLTHMSINVICHFEPPVKCLSMWITCQTPLPLPLSWDICSWWQVRSYTIPQLASAGMRRLRTAWRCSRMRSALYHPPSCHDI